MKNGVDVFRGKANIADAHTIMVSGKSHGTANIIVATGSGVKGLPDGIPCGDGVLTSYSLLEADSLPRDVVIVGGGVIGVEFAYFLATAGVKVTVVEFQDRLLPPLDGEIAALIEADLKRLGVDVRTGAKVTSADKNTVTFEKGGVSESVGAERVLVAVGRVARVPSEADRIGIATERGAIVTDERMRTSIPHIYAVGDVNGKAMLAHTASAEGIVAAENIAGRDSVMRYDAIPSAVYINPEAASIGLSEEDARARFGDSVRVGRFPIAANGKSLVEGETAGLVKVVVDGKYGEILGAHLYCPRATDMIAEIATAMRAEATAAEVAAAIHPHPTVSEAIQEAFHAALGAAIHC
jgi:dihydrolipoamide dehydrogenase